MPEKSVRSDSLIVFYKPVVAGSVKTRLAASVGTKNAALVYRALLEDLVAEISRIPVTVFPYAASDPKTGWSPWSKPYLQPRGDLGERMRSAIEKRLHVSDRAVLIGSDIPGLNARFILRAFVTLANHDVCLGPCRDGGYYLIGFTRDSFTDAYFADIPWSTGVVCERTCLIAERLGHRVALLDTLDDVDDIDDLKRLAIDPELRMSRFARTACKVLEKVV